MNLIIEITKMIIAASAGGGIMYLFNWRKRIQRQGNQIEGEDFDQVSKTVTQAMKDLGALSERIGQLERERVEIFEQISDLKRENDKLKKENQHLEKVLRDYISDKNPNIRR